MLYGALRAVLCWKNMFDGAVGLRSISRILVAVPKDLDSHLSHNAIALLFLLLLFGVRLQDIFLQTSVVLSNNPFDGSKLAGLCKCSTQISNCLRRRGTEYKTRSVSYAPGFAYSFEHPWCLW